MSTIAARTFLALISICITVPVRAVTCLDLDGAYVVSQDATPKYLGFIGSRFASESIMNPYGSYGSSYSTFSVRNTYGSYGSAYSSLSASNPFATRPPVIARAGQFLAFLTTNPAAGPLGVSLAQIDGTCTNLLSSLPISPVVAPQLPTYTPPAPTIITTTNGSAVGPLSGAVGDFYDLQLSVPTGASRLVFVTDGSSNGESGDVTLYLRRGALPESNAFDCRSATVGAARESCIVDAPQAGTWYATVVGATAFSGVYVVGGYQLSNLIGAHSAGIFWNAARSGEGMQVVYTQVGTTPVLGITFYTYDLQGNPMYLVGAAAIDRSKPGPHTIPVSMTRGARFGAAFNPSEVVATSWGTISLTYSDCDNPTVQYSSTVDGYGTGTIPMTRSVPRPEGVSCP